MCSTWQALVLGKEGFGSEQLPVSPCEAAEKVGLKPTVYLGLLPDRPAQGVVCFPRKICRNPNSFKIECDS